MHSIYNEMDNAMNGLNGRALAACCLAALAGCNQQGSGKVDAAIDQINLCQVNDWQHDVVAGICKPGQKLVFLPQSFGNEQLPVLFAAVNCDLRYHVAMTTGAVTCIYAPITPAKPKTPEPPPAKP